MRISDWSSDVGSSDLLTQWGLRTTLRQWLSWREQGLDTCLALNISALSLDQLDFPDPVERKCWALEVPTDRQALELDDRKNVATGKRVSRRVGHGCRRVL